MLAHYLLELALQEYQFLKYLPSVVATCCLSMAMYTIDGFPMVRLMSSIFIVPDLTLIFFTVLADEGTRRRVSVRLGRLEGVHGRNPDLIRELSVQQPGGDQEALLED